MNNQFNDHRPTAFEEQAYSETKARFVEHLKQFRESRADIQRLERNLPATAARTIQAAVLGQGGREDLLQTDDGSQWHQSFDLLNHVALCHRATDNGKEFAIVERLPLKSGETKEVLQRGRNAVEVLREFARDQQEVLQIWTNDVGAQVKEFLAERHPGKDMTRVADGFMNHLAHSVSLRETQNPNQSQKRSRGVRI